MGIEFEDIITLDDGNEYVVTSKINYGGNNYIYVVDINDHSNIKFAEVEVDNSQIFISEIDSSEKELLAKIMPLFLKDSQQIFQNIENNN